MSYIVLILHINFNNIGNSGLRLKPGKKPAYPQRFKMRRLAAGYFQVIQEVYFSTAAPMSGPAFTKFRLSPMVFLFRTLVPLKATRKHGRMAATPAKAANQ
jgi:hypothetical protein